MLKGAITHSVYLMKPIFQTSVLFNMRQWNAYKLIDCVNVGKRSEAVNSPFQ